MAGQYKLAGPVPSERLETDRRALETLKGELATALDRLPPGAVQVDKKVLKWAIDSLWDQLKRIEDARGPEQARLYADYHKKHAEAARMVQSYTDAAKAYKDLIEKEATVAGGLFAIKEEMTYLQRVYSATLITLPFLRLIGAGAQVAEAAWATRAKIAKEAAFFERLSREARVARKLSQIPGLRSLEAIEQSFSDPVTVNVLRSLKSNAEKYKYVAGKVLDLANYRKLDRRTKAMVELYRTLPGPCKVGGEIEWLTKVNLTMRKAGVTEEFAETFRKAFQQAFNLAGETAMRPYVKLISPKKPTPEIIHDFKNMLTTLMPFSKMATAATKSVEAALAL